MDERIAKYISDMLQAISEIELALDRFGKLYDNFESDVVFRKFVERNIEIMGEAMNRILKIDSSINITSARKIVDTRNYVIHAYDSLKPDILWAIVVNHIPRLKNELSVILNQ
ncbi:MAG: DUF86 domain-containing protein [Paramuribaculum sp.]|nr:DUF86 domain-containing protein [Paramuribaculum sp.]MDE5836606.1 DUF86 domain-containing protein [Paramuribaculum sp.]